MKCLRDDYNDDVELLMFANNPLSLQVFSRDLYCPLGNVISYPPTVPSMTNQTLKQSHLSKDINKT